MSTKLEELGRKSWALAHELLGERAIDGIRVSPDRSEIELTLSDECEITIAQLQALQERFAAQSVAVVKDWKRNGDEYPDTIILIREPRWV